MDWLIEWFIDKWVDWVSKPIDQINWFIDRLIKLTIDQLMD